MRHLSGATGGSTAARLSTGDLLDNTSALITEAPEDSRIVVFHSAVLLYLEAGRRDRFI